MAVDWKRWEKLTEFIEGLPARSVNMGFTLKPSGMVHDASYQALQAGEPHLRAQYIKAHPCGSVGCIAGWCVVRFAPRTTVQQLVQDVDYEGRMAEILGLNGEESEYVYSGGWSGKEFDVFGDMLRRIGKRRVVRYMRLALQEKNVQVNIRTRLRRARRAA